MHLKEILRQIESEAQILEVHMAHGKLDQEFLRNHADNLVNYGLLLRDLAVSKHPPERPFWRLGEDEEEGHPITRDRFEFFGDI